MMYNYPFFRFSPIRRYSTMVPPIVPVSNVRNINSVIPVRQSTQQKSSPSTRTTGYEEERILNQQSKQHTTFLNNLLHQEDREGEEPFFEIFGLKLYNDDVLLIGLIWFLYHEEVKDQYLFMALILLLLS